MKKNLKDKKSLNIAMLGHKRIPSREGGMDNPKKELLFVGMGCQSDGFRKFSEIKGIRDRVYIVDIIKSFGVFSGRFL